MNRQSMLVFFLLGICALAGAQQAPAPPKQIATTSHPASADYTLTDLQKARLDAARQEAFRWQDRLNEALSKFSQLCQQAQIDNHWPAGTSCNLSDLSVTQPPPVPSAANASSPEQKAK